MSPLFGFSVVVSPDPRRYGKLPADVCVTPAFRAEFDAWAAVFFPPDPALNVIKDDECFILNGRDVHVNPRTFTELKRQTCSSKELGK